jgi:Ca-activated chloride channel homolog
MEAVDLALVIALDGSASVTFDEFNLVTGAMGAALRDPGIVSALTAGPKGASALALLLWSGTGAQEVMVDWTRVADPAQAAVFAQSVADVPRVVRAGSTAIGEALMAAERLLADAPPALRRVIDMVGDGRSNEGVPPDPVRDRLVAAGVVINGLCVLHEEPDLVASYTNEVIGGNGAFALPCPDYDAFADAMQRKLLREIA